MASGVSIKIAHPLKIDAPIRAGFGYSTGYDGYHSGLDYSCVVGTPVYAVADGVVRYADYVNDADGLGVAISHPQWGVAETRYWHFSKVLVATGQKVKKGQLIGLSGNTGYSTGPHLHFDLRIGSAFVDPRGYYEEDMDVPLTEFRAIFVYELERAPTPEEEKRFKDSGDAPTKYMRTYYGAPRYDQKLFDNMFDGVTSFTPESKEAKEAKAAWLTSGQPPHIWIREHYVNGKVVNKEAIKRAAESAIKNNQVIIAQL